MPLIKPPASYAQGFHTKALVWRGIYVLGNGDVPDEAVYRAAEIVFNSISGLDQKIVDELVKYGTRFAVIPYGTEITELPDYDDLDASWSQYRGLGAVVGRPTSSSGEENLLPDALDDPYVHAESIGLHEWLHAIEGIGLAKGNPTLHAQFEAAYAHAVANDLWVNTYAGSNFFEYFAETAQVYFNNNPDLGSPDGIHNTINTRAELATYDPTIFALHEQLFGTTTWDVGDYFGSAVADSLAGTSGHDLILGNDGDDSLAGSGGNDNLQGGKGLDTLSGGSGKDLLEGGKGADYLRGGASADRFVFNTKLGNPNVDTIADFRHDSDLIALDNAIFRTIGPRLDTTEFFGRAGATKANDSSDRIIYDTATGVLRYDADGKGGAAAIHFATLMDGSKPATLDSGDFVIV